MKTKTILLNISVLLVLFLITGYISVQAEISSDTLIYSSDIDTNDIDSSDIIVTIDTTISTDKPEMIDIYAFTTPPVIDGIIDEQWKDNEFLFVENIIGNYSSMTNLEEGDYSIKFKMSWYGNNLYFLVVATDEDLVNNNEYSYENDGFTLIFDLGNEKSSFELDENDHNLIIPWGRPDIISIFSGDYSFEWILDTALYEYGENIDLEKNEFIAELTFNVKDFNMPGNMVEDVVFGFDFEANDIDLEGDNPVKEINAYWYSNTGSGWFDRSVSGSIGLGGIQLKSAKAVTDNKVNIFKNQLSIYPVPAKDILHIKSDHELSLITIYNISGMQVYKSQIHSNNELINIADFSNGIYNFLITDNYGIVTSKKVLVVK